MGYNSKYIEVIGVAVNGGILSCISLLPIDACTTCNLKNLTVELVKIVNMYAITMLAFTLTAFTILQMIQSKEWFEKLKRDPSFQWFLGFFSCTITIHIVGFVVTLVGFIAASTLSNGFIKAVYVGCGFFVAGSSWMVYTIVKNLLKLYKI